MTAAAAASGLTVGESALGLPNHRVPRDLGLADYPRDGVAVALVEHDLGAVGDNEPRGYGGEVLSLYNSSSEWSTHKEFVDCVAEIAGSATYDDT